MPGLNICECRRLLTDGVEMLEKIERDRWIERKRGRGIKRRRGLPGWSNTEQHRAGPLALCMRRRVRGKARRGAALDVSSSRSAQIISCANFAAPERCDVKKVGRLRRRGPDSLSQRKKMQKGNVSFFLQETVRFHVQRFKIPSHKPAKIMFEQASSASAAFAPKLRNDVIDSAVVSASS